jgi:hypothetical protein
MCFADDRPACHLYPGDKWASASEISGRRPLYHHFQTVSYMRREEYTRMQVHLHGRVAGSCLCERLLSDVGDLCHKGRR